MNVKGFNLVRGLTTFLLMIFSLSCSRLPEIPHSTTKPMIPVFEVFVYARCPNCPVVEDVLDSLKKVYGDSVVVLEYHLRVLGDTLSPETIRERQTLYSIGDQAPITVVHGEEKIMGNQGVTYDRFATYYRSIRSGREDSLGINGVLRDQAGDSLTFFFQCDTLLNLKSSKAFAFLTCDSVFFKQSGAPDSLFHNVVRFYGSYRAEFPLTVKVPRMKGNLILVVQDTLSGRIRGVFQRRL